MKYVFLGKIDKICVMRNATLGKVLEAFHLPQSGPRWLLGKRCPYSFWNTLNFLFGVDFPLQKSILPRLLLVGPKNGREGIF